MRSQLFLAATKAWRRSARILKRTDFFEEKRKGIQAEDLKNCYKVKDNLVYRLRYTLGELSSMASREDCQARSVLVPPHSVKGMKELSKEAFTKKVHVPGVKLATKKLAAYEDYYKPIQLRVKGISPIANLGEGDPLKETHRLVLFDPDRLATKPLSDEAKAALELVESEPEHFEIEMTYDNWTLAEVMRAILPDQAENVSSYTQIGHIAHLNLREESLPFKHLIGQVILDKSVTTKTVVNKLDEIDNTFRTFKMELLAGEENYVARVSELNCQFDLDFTKVYWNSRLSKERQRVMDAVETYSLVFDVFAGVGPFAVPLAKKRKCTVFANDLNPASFEYLKKNATLNKAAKNLESFNMDGREFIRTIMKKHLVEKIFEVSQVKVKPDSGDSSIVLPSGECRVTDSDLVVEDEEEYTLPINKSYVLMNLPGIAVEFLDTFNSLLKDLPQTVVDRTEEWKEVLPTVFCYSFVPKDCVQHDVMKAKAESHLGRALTTDVTVRVVRNVAPNKDMVCAVFKLWPELVLGQPEEGQATVSQTEEQVGQGVEEPECKRQKLSL